MLPSSRVAGLLILVAVLGLVLVACQETPQPAVMTVVPLTPQTAGATPGRQVLPQVVAGGQGASPVRPPTRPAHPVTVEPTPKPRMTVWRPREIAARVQVALAKTLDVKPADVPWVRYERSVDPAQFTCLDQLVGDIPVFGDGEALVYQYRDTLLYVVSSQGRVWVCRTE